MVWKKRLKAAFAVAGNNNSYSWSGWKWLWSWLNIPFSFGLSQPSAIAALFFWSYWGHCKNNFAWDIVSMSYISCVDLQIARKTKDREAGKGGENMPRQQSDTCFTNLTIPRIDTFIPNCLLLDKLFWKGRGLFMQKVRQILGCVDIVSQSVIDTVEVMYQCGFIWVENLNRKQCNECLWKSIQTRCLFTLKMLSFYIRSQISFVRIFSSQNDINDYFTTFFWRFKLRPLCL
jgi:hypothetical protein